MIIFNRCLLLASSRDAFSSPSQSPPTAVATAVCSWRGTEGITSCWWSTWTTSSHAGCGCSSMLATTQIRSSRNPIHRIVTIRWFVHLSNCADLLFFRLSEPGCHVYSDGVVRYVNPDVFVLMVVFCC